MHEEDPALDFSNPRLLSAIYFGLLSVVGTILINALLTLIGYEEIVPLFKAIVLGMIVASATGGIFGKHIVCCPRPYTTKVFGIGFIMVIVSLPFFALGLLYFIKQTPNALFSLSDFQSLAYTYIVVLAYSYILFGILLAIAAGFASIYLRAYLVYDILHTDKRKSVRLPKFVSAQNKSKAAMKFDDEHDKTL